MYRKIHSLLLVVLLGAAVGFIGLPQVGYAQQQAAEVFSPAPVAAGADVADAYHLLLDLLLHGYQAPGCAFQEAPVFNRFSQAR
jgi:hypothetical protein